MFKLIGPVLVKQELLEVKTNVSKRIEYIKNDMTRLEKNLKKKQDEIDGVRIEMLEYEPVPYATPVEFVRKTKAALLKPGVAARRLANRVGQPKAQPVVVQLTFPDGRRLLHLNCSLHRWTPAEWLDEAVARFKGADWILVGIDYEEEDEVFQRIQAFEGKQVLVTDFVNDTRRELGLPTGILTPTVDKLRAIGVDAYPFVEGASFRVE